MSLPKELADCLLASTSEGGDKDCVKDYYDIKTLETHVYIIYGAFGGIILLLITALSTLCCWFYGLKQSMEERQAQRPADNGNKYASPEPPKDELAKRGFESYTGQQQQQFNRQSQAATRPTPYNQNQQSRNSAVGPPVAARRPASGYGYDNTGYDSSGYERDRTAGGVRVLPGGHAPSTNSNSGFMMQQPGGGGKQQKDWGKKLEKGVERYEKGMEHFETAEKFAGYADQFGVSDAVLGGNIGDMPGMDQLGDVGDIAGQLPVGDAMGAFKNKGFGGKGKFGKW